MLHIKPPVKSDPIAVLVKPSGDVVEDTVHIIEKALKAWPAETQLNILDIVTIKLKIKGGQ